MRNRTLELFLCSCLCVFITWGCGPAPDGAGGLHGIVAADQAEYQPLNPKEAIQFNEGATPKQVFWNHREDTLIAAWERGYEDRGFLSFDPQDIPTGATIELELYVEADPESKFPLELTLSALEASWTIGAIANSNAIRVWPKTVAVATNNISSARSGWVRFDITSIVEQWRSNPSANFGLMLSGPIGNKSAAWVTLGGDTRPRLRLMKH